MSDDNTKRAGREVFGLVESLDGEWIKLPLAVMRDAGPAVQTLGGFLKVSMTETFAQVADIAKRARLPLSTVRKHLKTLAAGGWIVNEGRQRTRRGGLRRTATIKVSHTTIKAAEKEYGVLPWWACRTGRFQKCWSAKAVLSIVMAKLMSLKAVVLEQGDFADDEILDAIENLGGEDRFRFSLSRLERDTGLSRPAIVEAKETLHSLGIINWQPSSRDDGGDDTDSLAPSDRFRVVVTPASEGCCRVNFDGGRKVKNTG